MGRQGLEESEARFGAYVKGLTSVIGHADRAAPLKHYCGGLLAAQGRRSVEPLAAATAPAKVSVQHQKLLHFVGSLAKPALPDGCRPRGAPDPARAPRPELDRHRPPQTGGGDRSHPPEMPMLRPQLHAKRAAKFMMQ